jgi:putative intracellular protease/amidase/catechol 2,3-dioxygenase-like lactoylglutathione lyase family enzyme
MSDNEKKIVMNNEVLYIFLPDYAAHEAVYLSQAIASDDFALKENPKYVNKVAALTLEPVKSIGGFRTLPDYSFDTMPDEYAALVLIGGFGWSTPVAEQVIPIVKQAIEKGRIVGAICNAASFMAKHGFLNVVKHTGNGLEQLKLWGGDNYTNSDGYIHAQAVSDRNIVTANGSATLEFAKELLLLLENDTPERIEMYYQFNKQGACQLNGKVELEHFAMYVIDLEGMKDFFVRYFGAVSNELYHNVRTGFKSYFLSFGDGSQLEIMTRPELAGEETDRMRCGYIHMAVSVGSKEAVAGLTEKLRGDGYEIVGEPRTTGDGYYESCVAGPEGNLVEITI